VAGKFKSNFHVNRWKGGGTETVSGKGSTLAYTAPLRPALEALFMKLGVKTLLDAPCGDFNWMSHVNLSGIRYTGLDIIEDVIAQNIARHAREGREFRVADIRMDPLPRADLMLCRDCMFHLGFADIWRVLDNFARSGTPRILMTHHTVPANIDLPEGGYQSRNFLEAPFFLPRPAPESWLLDNPEGRGNRYLCLWSADEIRDAVARAKAEGRFPAD
jgi:hypothetical protein